MTVISVERGTHTDFYRQLPDLTMEHLGTLNDKTLAEGLLRLLNEPIPVVENEQKPFELEPRAARVARRRRKAKHRTQADWDKLITRSFTETRTESRSTREIIDWLKENVRQNYGEERLRQVILSSNVLEHFGSIPALPHLGTPDGVGARNHYIWKLK